MEPFALRTARLVLDQPTDDDVDDITRYCCDPVFEHFLTIPWPYTREDAVSFVDQYVTTGWADDREWTWAIRENAGAPLIGVIGVRVESGMVGFWLGGEHRGSGILPEALSAVVDAVFARTSLAAVRWECVVGNAASMRVAQKSGFTFTGSGPGEVRSRTGEQSASWTGVLRRDDDRSPKDGWPDLPRARREVPPARRTIRLFPDYGRDYPLWESSTPTWDVGYATGPDEYGLTPDLAAGLARWQAFWEAHHLPETGWEAQDHRRQWVREGRRLEARLREEVAAFADVQSEFDLSSNVEGLVSRGCATGARE